MGFYTKEELLSKGEFTLEREIKLFSQTVNENKAKTSFDIFLSHCHADKKYIRGLYVDLTKMGYDVYVDWIVDPHLSPDNVTKNTVENLRKRMKQSKSLVYATSQNSVNSKWMPWELGFMDGEKGRCAILPIVDNSYSDFKGLEFLSVYPYVTKDGFKNNPTNKVLWVNESSKTYATMKDWHNGVQPTFRN